MTAVPGNVKLPFADTDTGAPRFESTSPEPCRPSTVPPIVNVGGGGGGGWSSSRIVTDALRCLPSVAQRTWASETLKLSGDSAARSSRIGTSTSRGELSPFSKRTSVRVGLKSTPERAVPPLVLTVTLVAPRDPPVRVTSTNARAARLPRP